MIINQKEFCLYIENLFAENNENMIDTVLQACEDFNIDPLYVGKLINRSIKEKLEIEYAGLNLINIEKNFEIT